MKVLVAHWLVLLLLLASPMAPAMADDGKFSKQQLDQMLAPIALYPDDLLSNVLMASTYPLDVVEAQRWREEPENAKLAGDALTDAVKTKNWDPSIKALLLFPDVLKTLSEKLDWTQNLGAAFLNQQSEVMDQIQFLRSKADGSGHLKSNSQQKVVRQDDDYIIEPVNPDVVYVPVYEPDVVYGPWWYPDYPPYYWGYPGAVFDNGFWWGAAGVAIVGGIWGWNRWDWRRHDIHVDVNKWNKINGNRDRMVSDRWKHDPKHGGALRPRDKGIDRAEQRRELSKDLRRTDGDRAGMNKITNKGAPRDASRFRDKKQFHSPARKTGPKFDARPKRSFNRGAAQVRNFKAPRSHGAAHRGRRR
ncbi:DUF3300 domain-containing protein [Hyphomicrobium sp.]|uniref:DUF3300 domain-containing protein n=1 Tax=Hyphomicrobium sp. TaxID=82 RepID=UPI000F96911C|nr:DUF3300 domain-containing protein [Hyphomicrobium sp.]RUP10751.1 MAG: DUF3300 domain-containing protein [Hyphomicrobium sp.]